MPAGRPSILNEELIEKAKQYLPTCIDTPMETDKGAISYVDVNLPTKVGLALFLNINKDTLNEWCKGETELHKEFSVIVSEVEAEQEKRLINKTLGGLYQPKTSNMLLAKHGYSEKTETDITSGGEKISFPTAINIVKPNGDNIQTE